MSISSIGSKASMATASTTAKSANTALAGSGMNADTFMKLFTTQLANQNPMDPTNPADFLNQFSQMAQVQTMNQMGNTLTGLTNSMDALNADSAINKAQGMLGHHVQYVDANGKLNTGLVNALQIQPDASLNLLVSDVSGTTTAVGVSNVIQVGQ